MKAEQRKELETNILADKMGRVVHRVKASPKRTVLLYFIAAAAIVLLVGFSYRYYRTSVEANMDLWIALDDGAQDKIRYLAQRESETNAGKAAAFQVAWIQYWDQGIKALGADPRGALLNIEAAKKEYEALATLCKDDPMFEPQALLGIAVCEEGTAVQDPSRLEKAADKYEALSKHEKYKETAEAKFAEARLAKLRDSKGKIRAEARDTYKTLHRLFNVPDIQAPDQFHQPPLNIEDLFKGKK